jgi:hypothetical protein
MRLLALGVLLTATAWAAEADFNGRWLIAPEGDGPGRVGWLEVVGAGSARISGSAVGLQPGGQVDPIADAVVRNGELMFHVERPVGRGADRRMQSSVTTARLVRGEMLGVTRSAGKELRWTGRRAPEISDRDDGSWSEGTPVVLFDGGDRDAWVTLNPRRDAEWSVEGGALVNSPNADELVSKRKFWNFRLLVEYAVDEGSNSGVGLRGRYEVQIYDDYGRRATKSGNGALYSRKAADLNASRPAGERQVFEITLIGRDLTVKLNGKRIHEKVDVHGLTAMATDWREDEPGPITLQGDHGPVKFYRIVATPLERR